ncbi:MAG: pyruvate formate lyase-activating protein [Eubacteriaceae bacterium]|nr:pyruvate formate lyase-activating protein [Eubacteriaceae bacterium]
MENKITGRINSLETFGTVDGPGIRFIVFMQGCPLRCIYCHNRDSWDINGGREVSVDEIMTDLLKYKEYFMRSGGGITVSGGEPTLQAEFVTELFKRCKASGIHTALDTSGFAEVSGLDELLSYTDLILLDVKQTDEMKHREITGVGLEKIHRFTEYISKKNIPVWIRYVLVPGYTDGMEDLDKAASFIGKFKNIEKVEVLPYHGMGQCKWDSLGKEYQLKDLTSPDDQEVKRAKIILSSHLQPTHL